MEPLCEGPRIVRARRPSVELIRVRAVSDQVYRRLGDLELARAHLQLGPAALGALDDDAYAQMVMGGLDRLAVRLSET